MATRAVPAAGGAGGAGKQEAHRWKILISSQVFHPKVGGIETVSKLLAEEFAELGHEVTLVTLEKWNQPDRFPFRVIRRPGPAELLREVAACDIYWQNHIGLKTAWPALLLRKPWVVTLHGGLGSGFRARLKRAVLAHAVCINISNFMANVNHYGLLVLRNPYDNRNFRIQSNTRSRELVFLGRLEPEKGASALPLLLQLLRERSLQPKLTIIGDGQERTALERHCLDSGLGEQVDFVGVKEGPELAETLNSHQIMVIPSFCDESFGIVALEGIACGCVVAGFDTGGLHEAVGPCGVLVPRGDVRALADAIEALLKNPDQQAALRARADEHLAHFSCRSVALEYLEVFHSLLCAGGTQCGKSLGQGQ